jgi:hypothetical protein
MVSSKGFTVTIQINKNEPSIFSLLRHPVSDRIRLAEEIWFRVTCSAFGILTEPVNSCCQGMVLIWTQFVYMGRIVKMRDNKKNERIICGMIFPAKWDEKGEVERLVIDTADQDEYFIGFNKKGKELVKYLRRNVEVTGDLTEDKDGNFIMNVIRYRLMENDESLKTNT